MVLDNVFRTDSGALDCTAPKKGVGNNALILGERELTLAGVPFVLTIKLTLSYATLQGVQ